MFSLHIIIFNLQLFVLTSALYSSVELAEDDPKEGARCLQQITKDQNKVVYIGVTCGLSAPFVAGQLDYCLSHPDIFMPVLLGFNAEHQARKLSMTYLNKTFYQVVLEMMEAEKLGKAFILNPVVGPEPIAGSSRMKSGSATKIILEMLSFLAFDSPEVCFSVNSLTTMYEAVCKCAYKEKQGLGSLIQMAGEGLRSGGHLYYLGCDGLGLMAIIDASECLPTFGSAFEDIRGFVYGGIDGLDSQPIHKSLSTKDFDEEILPKLKPVDTVIVFGKEMFSRLNPMFFSTSSQKAFVDFVTNKTKPKEGLESSGSHLFDIHVIIDVESAIPPMNLAGEAGTKALSGEEPDSFQTLVMDAACEMALKWVVNTVSTGAHILLGKVFRNLMVDVRVSNAKLFHRAVGLAKKICGLTEEESRVCLLRSIYEVDHPQEHLRNLPVVEHVMMATTKSKIVPKALLVGLTGCSIQEATSLLEQQPNLSQVLRDPQLHNKAESKHRPANPNTGLTGNCDTTYKEL